MRGDEGRVRPVSETRRARSRPARSDLEIARSGLRGLELIDALVRDIATFNAGLLKIVAPPSLSEGVLSTILTRFLDRFPKVRVSIDSRGAETARNMVANRTANCGFVKLHGPRRHLDLHPVGQRDRLRAARRSPLARHAFLTPELLRAEPLVLLGFGAWSRARSTTLSASAACGLTSSWRLTPSAQPAPSPPRVSALAPMNRLAAALLEEARAYFDGAGDGRKPG